MANWTKTTEHVDTDTHYKMTIQFEYQDAAVSDATLIDVSGLNWAVHTMTLSGAASPYLKVGEVISTAAGHSAVGDGSEFFVVVDYTAGASTVDVIGWDYTNKKATAILTTMSNADKVVGSYTGLNTRTVANSGAFTEKDYILHLEKIMWNAYLLDAAIFWAGDTTDSQIHKIVAAAAVSTGTIDFADFDQLRLVSPGHATGAGSANLGNINWTLANAADGDWINLGMVFRKIHPGYSIPNYQKNMSLGYPTDQQLGNL